MCCMSVFVLRGACWEVVRRKNNDYAQGKKTVKKYEQESQVGKNSVVENKRNQDFFLLNWSQLGFGAMCM